MRVRVSVSVSVSVSVCVCVCVCSAYFLVYFPQAYLSETGDPKPSEIPYFLPEIDSSGVSNSDKYRGNDTHLEAGNSHIFHFGISRKFMSFQMEYPLVNVYSLRLKMAIEIVDLPTKITKNGDFPPFFVCLPEALPTRM